MAVFPLPFVPKQNYRWGGLSFGSSRSGGKRTHAACDLIAPRYTEVRAVENGVVIQDPKKFYRGTYSIAVKHLNFIVRYCEIERDVADGIYEGAYVYEGQTIAYVGKMYRDSMLHLEMYKGTAQGKFKRWNKRYDYVKSKNYNRRRDLMNPAPYLDKWRLLTTFS